MNRKTAPKGKVPGWEQRQVFFLTSRMSKSKLIRSLVVFMQVPSQPSSVLSRGLR